MTRLDIKLSSPRCHHALPASGEIHLWRKNIDELLDSVDVLSRMLSPQEQTRAHRIVFEKHRQHFILAKAWSRSVLCSYLDKEHCDVPLTVDARGKPHIVATENHADLRFSLSHCDRFAMLAVSVKQNVGVDIEFPISNDLEHTVIERILTSYELAYIHDLAPRARAIAITEIWTRKEAIAKAIGTGLTSQVFSCTVGPSTWGQVCCGDNLWVCSIPHYDLLVGAVAVQRD